MSYQTYTTKAIVCGTYDKNTADRSFLLFTREAGMLYATARSVRNEASKQRPALQNFTQIRVSLVKGKTGWRVGSVESRLNYYSSAVDRTTRGAVVSVVQLLRRFLTGEEVQPAVYDDVEQALDRIIMQPLESAWVVDVFTLRLLATLGYVAPHESYTDLLVSEVWTQAAAEIPKVAKSAIERGFTSSHL